MSLNLSVAAFGLDPKFKSMHTEFIFSFHFQPDNRLLALVGAFLKTLFGCEEIPQKLSTD